MSKVTDDQALIHEGLAFDADTRTTTPAEICWVCVGRVYAQRDGVGGIIDGNEACCLGVGITLVPSERAFR